VPEERDPLVDPASRASAASGSRSGSVADEREPGPGTAQRHNERLEALALDEPARPRQTEPVDPGDRRPGRRIDDLSGLDEARDETLAGRAVAPDEVPPDDDVVAAEPRRAADDVIARSDRHADNAPRPVESGRRDPGGAPGDPGEPRPPGDAAVPPPGRSSGDADPDEVRGAGSLGGGLAG
jgi:hypothetical protein